MEAVSDPSGPPPPMTSRGSTRNYLTPTDKELHAANFLESGATRHISELPKKIVEIMANHRTLVHSLFDTLDADGNGECSVQEFVGILRSIGLAQAYTEQDVVMLFKAVDADNDGSITFEELDTMVHNVKRGKAILKAEDPAERKKREDEARALRAAKQAEEEARLRAAEEAAEAERLRLEAEAAAKAAREAEAAARAARLAAKRAAAAEEAARRAAAKKAEEEAEAARKAAAAALVTMKPKDEEAARRPPPPWNNHVHPRVERSSKRQAIAFRAKPDPRPSSVAFETTAEIPDHQRAPGGLAMLPANSEQHLVGLATTTKNSVSTLSRQASLAGTLSRPASALSFASSIGSAVRSAPLLTEQHRDPSHPEYQRRALEGRPPSGSVVEQTHFGYGSKRSQILVQRVGPHHYVFTLLSDHNAKPISGKPDLDMGAGGILDKDSVATALEKLQVAFPDEVPLKVPWRPGSTAMRSVRYVLLTGRHVALREGEEIRKEVLKGCFNTLCGPRPESGAHLHAASGWGWMQPLVSQRAMLRHQGMQATKGSAGMLRTSVSASTLLGQVSIQASVQSVQSSVGTRSAQSVSPGSHTASTAKARRPYSAALQRAISGSSLVGKLHRPKSAPSLRRTSFVDAPDHRRAPRLSRGSSRELQG